MIHPAASTARGIRPLDESSSDIINDKLVEYTTSVRISKFWQNMVKITLAMKANPRSSFGIGRTPAGSVF
jgi:hypothetical protein